MPKKIDLPDVPWIPGRRHEDPHLVRCGVRFRIRGAAGGERAPVCGLPRREAGIYLLGLLADLPPDGLEDREHVVQALGYYETASSAAALFGEIRRVKSSNTTRRYLDSVLRSITVLPAPLVRTELEALADDTAFSYKMRAKFREAIWQLREPRT